MLADRTFLTSLLGNTDCGQVFFDENLNNLVEAYDPYAKNPSSRTPNVDDYYLAEEVDDGSDPFVEWVWLDKYGVLAWIILGINMSNVRDVSVSGTHVGRSFLESHMRQIE